MVEFLIVNIARVVVFIGSVGFTAGVVYRVLGALL